MVLLRLRSECILEFRSRLTVAQRNAGSTASEMFSGILAQDNYPVPQTLIEALGGSVCPSSEQNTKEQADAEAANALRGRQDVEEHFRRKKEEANEKNDELQRLKEQIEYDRYAKIFYIQVHSSIF